MKIVRRPIGFECDILAGGPFSVVQHMAHVFRPVLLTVDPACADGTLHSLQIANRDQLLSPTPLAHFCPSHWASFEAMERAVPTFDTASIGQLITLVVSFPTQRRLRATMIGLVPDDRDSSTIVLPEIETDLLVAEAEKAVAVIDEAYEPGVGLDWIASSARAGAAAG